MRYLIFTIASYYPGGGFEDLFLASNEKEFVDSVIKGLEELKTSPLYNNLQIIDLETKKGYTIDVDIVDEVLEKHKNNEDILVYLKEDPYLNDRIEKAF